MPPPSSQLRYAVLKRGKRPLYHVVHSLTGIRLAAVCHFRQFQQFMADFPAPVERVRPLVPDGLALLERTPGTTLLRIAALRYPWADLVEPYEELSISVPVRVEIPRDGPGDRYWTDGEFHLYLPVTSEEARWSGVEIYGFPKFVAEMDFEETPESYCCRVQVEGQPLINMEVQKVPHRPLEWDCHYYSLRAGRLVHVLWQVRGQAGVSDEPGRAFMALGNHPYAQRLRQLEIERSAVWRLTGEDLSSVLHKPEVVA